MRIIFMGAGRLACPALKTLADRKADEIVAVVTQPDRPSGRRRQLSPCPARQVAEEHGLRVLTPERVSGPAMVEELRGLAPDLIVVADFGQFLKADVLAIPPKGTINIHPSLLPRYRGAAPIQWAVARGETETGVTIMYVDERMDAGGIILQEKAPIREEDTAETLEGLLAELGASLLVRAVEQIRDGTVERTVQDEALVTLAPKLKKEDGRIDWSLPAVELRNRVRGFQPWPGAFCEAPRGSGRILKVLRARVEQGSGEPGIVLEAGERGPLVACGAGALRLLEVQPEGGKSMAGDAYLRGHPLEKGAQLG